jgi:hypothetical protein
MSSRYGSQALAEGARLGCRIAESVITPSLVAGFAGGPSVITAPSVAGCAESAISGGCGHRECRPPDRRTEIPAACRYVPAVSRRTPTSRSMRLSDHPSRPSASICSRLSSFKTFVIPAEGPRGPPPRQTSRSCPVVAGFQVIIGGRFWVITETLSSQSKHDDARTHPGRVRSDIAEADVQCDERTALGLNDCEYLWIRPSAQSLIQQGDRVVAGSTENKDALPGQILVELELHPEA